MSARKDADAYELGVGAPEVHALPIVVRNVCPARSPVRCLKESRISGEGCQSKARPRQVHALVRRLFTARRGEGEARPIAARRCTQPAGTAKSVMKASAAASRPMATFWMVRVLTEIATRH